MEAILLQHNTAMPGRHILEALADKFRYLLNSLVLKAPQVCLLSSIKWLNLFPVSVNQWSGRGKLSCNSNK